MTSNEQAISVLFRLLNFAVLLYGMKYVYVHYIRSVVQSDIESDEKKIAILAQQKDAGHQQELFIAQEIQTQQETIAHLMQSLATWQSVADERQRVEREAHQKCEEKLRKKVAEQSKHIAHYMLEQRALPLAIHDLEKSLAQYFSHKNRGSEYIASVVDHMDKDR